MKFPLIAACCIGIDLICCIILKMSRHRVITHLSLTFTSFVVILNHVRHDNTDYILIFTANPINP